MNLRPSGYEPDELPGCSIPRRFGLYRIDRFRPVAFIGHCRPQLTLDCELRYFVIVLRVINYCRDFIRFGGDLLSHDLSRSTIGASALNFRVRKGTGCFARAMTTKPNKISFSKSVRFVLV